MFQINRLISQSIKKVETGMYESAVSIINGWNAHEIERARMQSVILCS